MQQYSLSVSYNGFARTDGYILLYQHEMWPRSFVTRVLMVEGFGQPRVNRGAVLFCRGSPALGEGGRNSGHTSEP